MSSIMKRLVDRLDAAEQIFFGRQLEHVKAKTYDILYPELLAPKLFPVSYEAGAGADTIKYEQFDMVGMAKIIASYANDLPRCDVKGKEFIANVKSLGASYGYNIQEVRAAAMKGMPLAQRKANAAKRAIKYLENYIAFFGDTDHNLPGFLSNANIPNALAEADGVGATSTWTTKTPDQIIRDINDAVNDMRDLTKGVEAPDTLLLPEYQYGLIASTPRASNSDATILDFVLRTNPWLKQVIPCFELKGTGTGTADQFVIYNRNPDKVELNIPSEFEQFPPQEKGLEFEIPCHQRMCGTIVYYPLSASKVYGI